MMFADFLRRMHAPDKVKLAIYALTDSRRYGSNPYLNTFPSQYHTYYRCILVIGVFSVHTRAVISAPAWMAAC